MRRLPLLAVLTTIVLAGCLPEGNKLPALDAGALSNVPASALTGKMPAMDASALTNLSTANLVGPVGTLDGSAMQGMNLNAACCRISLSSTEPVPSGNLTGGTIYYLPYGGDSLPLFDGTVWRNYTVPENSLLSLAVPMVAATNYDVFAYLDAGAVRLELGPAWASDSTRAANLALARGVYVKSTDATRRYLGTFRTTSAGTTEDSLSKRLVWNHHQRVRRQLFLAETTPTWTIPVSTWRPANNNANNRIDCVAGLADAALSLTANELFITTGSDATVDVKLVDSLAPAAPSAIGGFAAVSITGGGFNNSLSATLHLNPAAGFHHYLWAESSNVSVTGSGAGGLSYMQGTFED